MKTLVIYPNDNNIILRRWPLFLDNVHNIYKKVIITKFIKKYNNSHPIIKYILNIFSKRILRDLPYIHTRNERRS